MMKHRRFSFHPSINALSRAALVSLLILGSITLHAAPRGVLRGTVVNVDGSPAASAQVFCQTADGKSPRAIRANARGEFEIAALDQGYYELRAAKADRWSNWEHNVMVRSGKETSITLRLVAKRAKAAPAPAPSPASTKPN